MRRSLYLTFLSLLLLAVSAQAQKKVTLSGYIKDLATGETLIAANVYIKSEPSKGTLSNLYGFYSLSLLPGDYTLVASYLGYEDQEFNLSLTENQKLDIELSQGVTFTEIVVTEEEPEVNVESTEMGTVELPIEKLAALPALLGEVDVLKTLQLLPGVLSAGEGNAGFYVRGGGPDQNLILLDEAIVYNSGHLFGFFSVFNADAIKNTTLIKGSMPANYGGRLSSVVDIQMKDGNNKNFGLQGGIGLIASRLTLEGPIQQEKSSFIISGRRTYAFDLAQPVLNNTDFRGTNYYFYDLNTKVNFQLSDKDRLFFSAYFGKDVLNFSSVPRDFKFRMPWGNTTATLRWNHLFSNRLFMNASVIYNDYEFEAQGDQTDFTFRLVSGVRDWNTKVDFDFYPSANHAVKFGLNYTYHTFTPNSATAASNDIEFDNEAARKFANESAIYILDDFKLNDRLSFNAGLRFSMFAQVGPFTNADSSRVFGSFEPVKRYFGFEPRLAANYRLTPTSSLKAGFARTNQYTHLVVNSTSTLPFDLWVPSTERVKPQIGNQYAIGYFRNFNDNKYEFSVEAYYKDLSNQIDYNENYVPDVNTDEEDEFVFGNGEAYGIEWFLKKRTGKLNGWIGYTLSKTTRSFPDIDEGRTFPAKYDRRHDLSIVASYELNDKWTFGSTFVYGTGNTFTIPESFFLIDFQLNANYGVRNGARFDAYHRLDLSATWKPKGEQAGPFSSSWTFSIYNVYNRQNTFLIFYDPSSDAVSGDLSLRAVKLSLFPVIPSVTWNFKWNQS